MRRTTSVTLGQPLDNFVSGLIDSCRYGSTRRWCVGFYPVSNVPDWIAGSCVFVLPSYREGTPRSTQEAMAMGRAVIISDAPGCRETVEQGVNGFIVPCWNAQALADKMIHLIENPTEITRMGNESYRIAVDKFDANKANQRLMEILELKTS